MTIVYLEYSTEARGRNITLLAIRHIFLVFFIKHRVKVMLINFKIIIIMPLAQAVAYHQDLGIISYRPVICCIVGEIFVKIDSIKIQQFVK